MTATKRRAHAKLASAVTSAPVDPAIELARAEKAKRAKKPKLAATEGRAAPEVVNAAVAVKPPKVKAPPRPQIKAHSILKSGKMSARGLTCLCGCGSPTVTSDARFVPGHDAKLRQRVLGGAPLPEIIRPFFENGETIAGLWLNEEGEIEDVKAGSAVA